MKIGKYECVGGPNWQFYAATAGILYWSYQSWSVLPIIGWALFWIILTPICIKLHEWNEREDAKMARDFPLDPFIQKKYDKSKPS
jgi:hypothetical protein